MKRYIYPKSEVLFKDWFWLFFLGFITHALLDCFTTWGTQLFYPFSNYGVAFYSVFVVDPLYTVPIILALGGALLYNRKANQRRWLNALGLLLSSLYLVVGVANQAVAAAVLEENLEHQQISYEEYICKPTPFNTILWSYIVKTENGYYTGYYSLFDQDQSVTLNFLPKNKAFLQQLTPTPKLERLLEITKGYYSIETDGENVFINDLRFGSFNSWKDEQEGEFVFVYKVTETEENNQSFEQISFRFKPDLAYFQAFWDRMMGKKVSAS